MPSSVDRPNKEQSNNGDTDSYSDNEYQKVSSIGVTEEYQDKATINTTNYNKASGMKDFEQL